MTDSERFEELINGGCACVSMVTDEEEYALDIVRSVAGKLSREVWIWSASEGVRDGLSLLDDVPPVKETENPERGLSNLAGSKPGSICVTLDLAEHIRRSGKPQRIVRDMISRFEKTDRTLVMIDTDEILPDVIRAYAKTYTGS